MKTVAASMAVLIASAAAWMPVAQPRVGVALEARGKGKASTADGERRIDSQEMLGDSDPMPLYFVVETNHSFYY